MAAVEMWTCCVDLTCDLLVTGWPAAQRVLRKSEMQELKLMTIPLQTNQKKNMFLGDQKSAV